MWTKISSDDYEHPHKHRCELDGEGNGTTIDTTYGAPHTHEVENYVIKEKLGHTHDMQDGSKDIRGYSNSGENTFVDDDKGLKRLKEEIAKRDKSSKKLEVSVTVKVADD